jgi:hypothetical protein
MTDTITAYVPVHVVDVNRGDGYDFATCSCGWTGELHGEAVWAEIDALAHHEGVASPPDGLDRAMSDLLDLQDDLAEVVVWLAENWSADLPVPTVRGCNHYDDNHNATAGVRVSAYTSDTTEVARSAARLGVPVITDAGPNSLGRRYHRAIRTFGRVQVEVYTSAGETAS